MYSAFCNIYMYSNEILFINNKNSYYLYEYEQITNSFVCLF